MDVEPAVKRTASRILKECVPPVLKCQVTRKCAKPSSLRAAKTCLGVSVLNTLSPRAMAVPFEGSSKAKQLGTAKNVIVAGAAENVRAFGGADASGVADTGANSANDIIDFSSRGPCSDGRNKPDCVAPGEPILSCRHDPPAISARKPPTTDDLYYKLDGTSMAAPHVSGLIACYLSLKREFIGQPEKVKKWLVDNEYRVTKAIMSELGLAK